MASPEQLNEQQVLAMLLSNAELRAQFRCDPQRCLTGLGLPAALQGGMLLLDPEQLETQAATLLGKRWRAVRGLIPESSFANPGISRERFMVYASDNWPSGHRRHECDALAFLQYCLSAGIAISRAELMRLELRLGRRWISLLPVRIQRTGGRIRTGLLLQYRRPGTTQRELLIRTL
jgi:hypothetical protein